MYFHVYENKMHAKKVSLLWSNERNPANISCSGSLIVTLEKGLKTCSKLTRKTLERRYRHDSGTVIYILEHIFSFS